MKSNDRAEGGERAPEEEPPPKEETPFERFQRLAKRVVTAGKPDKTVPSGRPT
jgi:hypothetical protein